MIVQGNVSVNTAAGPLTVTVSHIVAAGSGRILMVGVSFNNNLSEIVSSVTYNGVNLAQLIAISQSNDSRAELWKLDDPPVGTFDVVVTFDSQLAVQQGAIVGVVDYTGVDTAGTPIGTVASASGASGSPSVNVSSAANEVVFDTVAAEDMFGESFTVGAGQAQLWQDADGDTGSSRYEAGAGSSEPGAATVTMSWSISVSTDWALVAAALLPSTSSPPTVDAGGPYNGPSGQATALNATVTPGSDPTPALLWTIDSGGAGTFSDDTIEDPTFTPTLPTVGPYVLRLTATPNDGPAVFDTANFESDPVAPTVDAGGPYAGGVSTPIVLNATVTPGTDPAPTLLWTIDSGGTGTFSDDTIEDPTFTADGIGAYVLRLTATPNDGPDVFDTAALTTAALADAVFLGGRLLRGGTGDLVMSQLSLGADPPGGDVVFVKGTAHSNAGAMYVAEDDGAVARVFIAGIAHQHNGVRLVTFNTPVVNLNAWGLDANGAQGIAASGAGQPHEGILLRGDGQMVVDGVAPGPVPPPSLPGNPFRWWDLTDGSQVFNDIAGLVPAIEGDNIRRLNDKGSDGADLIHAASGLQYRLGVVNGLAVGRSTLGGGDSLSDVTVNGFTLPGLTFAAVVKDVSVDGTQAFRQFDGFLSSDLSVNNAGFWNVNSTLPPVTHVSTKAPVSGEWVWAYGAHGAAGLTGQVSGSAQATAGAAWASFTGGGSIFVGHFVGDIAELIFWDDVLTSVELTQLIAYFNAKYGIMPF